jgi:hypothetical protein
LGGGFRGDVHPGPDPFAQGATAVTQRHLAPVDLGQETGLGGTARAITFS